MLATGIFGLRCTVVSLDADDGLASSLLADFTWAIAETRTRASCRYAFQRISSSLIRPFVFVFFFFTQATVQFVALHQI